MAADEAPQDEKQPEAPEGEERKLPWVKAGVAFGIGSAAVVAALLYAGRTREKRKK